MTYIIISIGEEKMEKVTDEIIIGSLFMCGYDVVDRYTYLYVLNNVINSEEGKKHFVYESQNNSMLFLNYVDYKDDIYKVKSLSDISDTSISFGPNEKYKNPVELLPRNNKLIEFILNIDVENLVKGKLSYYGVSSYYEYDYCFSTKEKEVRDNKMGSHYKSLIKDVDKSAPNVRTLKMKSE